MSKYKPILYDELFKLIAFDNEDEWRKFSSDYEHIFTPGFHSDLPDTEIYELFNHYQFLSIEYWNIYCSSLISSESNKIRSDELLEKYHEIWQGKKTNNKPNIFIPEVDKSKIKKIDDFTEVHYGIEEFLDPPLSITGPHFSETVFCTILYSFFEDILTTFVFEISGNKCFFNNIKYKRHYFYNTVRHKCLYKDYMHHSIKKPQRKEYKNTEDYNEAIKRYYDLVEKSLPEIKNNEWLDFLENNKVMDNEKVPDYIVKAKYIDERCNSDLFSDVIDHDRFKEFKQKRNEVMHAKSKSSNISTIECFDIIADVLNYLHNNKNIINQFSICVRQNQLRIDLDALDDDTPFEYEFDMTY